ncbi:MAG: hypothetical protein HC881_20220 [Leptolyngbyaceae cyanobacterium SL_7_1]|nr:hypothetical protein [Leptolyngbyaceae cyanobacterium SL_7_1]
MARLDFKGKAFVQNHHLTLKYHHLVPNKVASLTGASQRLQNRLLPITV